MIHSDGKEASRLGVTRQSIIGVDLSAWGIAPVEEINGRTTIRRRKPEKVASSRRGRGSTFGSPEREYFRRNSRRPSP